MYFKLNFFHFMASMTISSREKNSCPIPTKGDCKIEIWSLLKVFLRFAVKPFLKLGNCLAMQDVQVCIHFRSEYSMPHVKRVSLFLVY